MQKFPDDLNHETFSMIYASMKLLLKESMEIENESFKTVLSKCIERHLAKKDNRGETKVRVRYY